MTVAEQSPRAVQAQARASDRVLGVMRDSHVAAMAYLWGMPRPESFSILQEIVANPGDAEFALRFVAVSIFAERGADLNALLRAPLHSLLADLSDDPSIAHLQQRRDKIARTCSLLQRVDADVDPERFVLDADYASDALSRLVLRSGDGIAPFLQVGDVNSALSLAALYDHDPAHLFATHLAFAFGSVQDPDALREYVDQVAAVIPGSDATC